jgi:hypothetical protein
MFFIHAIGIAGGYLNALAAAQKKDNKGAKYTLLSITSTFYFLKGIDLKPEEWRSPRFPRNVGYAFIGGPLVAGAYFCLGSQLYKMIGDID